MIVRGSGSSAEESTRSHAVAVSSSRESDFSWTVSGLHGTVRRDG